jgi:hypothetical protein
MGAVSTKDQGFLGKIDAWLRGQEEALVLFRYSHAAGSKDFELFSSFEELSMRLSQLPVRASVIVFKPPQLPLRGVVDDDFIGKCLSCIPNGSEYLVLETVRRAYGRMSWFHHDAGTTHAELRSDLEELRGAPVAAGLHPLWLEDTDDVISAVVPDENGEVKRGIY